MAHRIDIARTIPDNRAKTLVSNLQNQGFKVSGAEIVDSYTIDADLDGGDMRRIADSLTNPVFQEGRVDDSFKPRFDYAVEIGFLPGVTDNIGNTVREGMEDSLKRNFDGQIVYSSRVLFLSGDLTREDAQRVANGLANPLIQRINVIDYREFVNSRGFGSKVPRVRISEKPSADLIDILNADDHELQRIGKQGIANPDGTRRGPLALDLTYMGTIRDYFARQGRNPSDVELESIAQTWSEHCRHTIFADPIDDIESGLFKHFIRRATDEIRRAKGNEDFCVSVFRDNSGAIAFGDYLITDKVETHNSPSALDPFGGSATGIVGVKRDAMGFGLGAKPILFRYGFCFGNPDDERPLFKGENKTQKMLSPRRIMNGVIEGVNAGGNQSGVATPQGFVYFDDKYRGKPLVFVGVVGLIPREVNGRKLYEKRAMPGDYIVMAGGRVGKDGIHGATFSSEAIDSGSPATAVQIADPITQKKMNDAIVKEARDLKLFTSITDNGAGGLSCSVAEMAKESGGFFVDLNKVPLKYPGLQPWETWVSESQERMTLSVPKDKWDEFSGLMQRRGVEATVIGEFTDSGKCLVNYDGKNVMDLDINFLHDGLPKRRMTTKPFVKRHAEPNFSELEDLTLTLHSMLGRRNIASFGFISRQYDHEVQGNSVLKPLQGRGLVNADATVAKPLPHSNKGIVLSHGINPRYSEIDTYNMAAAAIDTAVRNAVSAGADFNRIALLDNFCWCSPDDPERLGQLKSAALACYDTAVAYGTPFISGKDSMFNDFKGFDENGKPIKISVPPTLLVSSLGIIDDVRKAVSLDAKIPGDVVYLIGENDEEMGGSEYFAMVGEQQKGEAFIGNLAPRVETGRNRRAYESFSRAIERELISSAQSVHRGGLGIALAKTAMGGMLGLDVSLQGIKGLATREDYQLYSETSGRILVTVNPANAGDFEETMKGSSVSRLGTVRTDDKFIVKGMDGKRIIGTSVNTLLHSYKSTFRGY